MRLRGHHFLNQACQKLGFAEASLLDKDVAEGLVEIGKGYLLIEDAVELAAPGVVQQADCVFPPQVLLRVWILVCSPLAYKLAFNLLLVMKEKRSEGIRVPPLAFFVGQHCQLPAKQIDVRFKYVFVLEFFQGL